MCEKGDHGKELPFEEVGYWSEIKLDIVRKYAKAYSTILAKQPRLKHFYIDAFAGAGKHISRVTKEFIPGSPLNALNVEPPFVQYHFIDIKREKVEALEALSRERTQDVKVYRGDCNEILLSKVFPSVRYEDYRRALCLLDPYGLHLNWKVIETAGRMGSIEIFLNFPVYDIHRNVLLRNREAVDEQQKRRLNRYWGDETWGDIAYDASGDLFGYPQKEHIKVVAEAFRERLQTSAGFGHVPEPIPMRNSVGAIVYYLFFASPKPVAKKIVKNIFDKYRDRGV
jgi:three-Cys-motif partner protein